MAAGDFASTIEGWWQKAVQSSGEVAVAGVGGGAAYFADAAYNFLTFTDPLTSLAPGAIVGVGLFKIGKIAFVYRGNVARCAKASLLADSMKARGSHELADKVSRLTEVYDAGQIRAGEFAKELDRIRSEYTARPAGPQLDR